MVGLALQAVQVSAILALPPCVQEGRLRSLLGQQRYGAAVELMQAALRQAGSGTDGQAGGDVEAAGAAAAGAARRRVARQRQVEQGGRKKAGQRGQRTATEQARQQAEQAQQTKPDPDAEPALSPTLRAAAHGEAAAAEGLVPELVAAFLGVLPQLRPREQADKVGVGLSGRGRGGGRAVPAAAVVYMHSMA